MRFSQAAALAVFSLFSISAFGQNVLRKPKDYKPVVIKPVTATDRLSRARTLVRSKIPTLPPEQVNSGTLAPAQLISLIKNSGEQNLAGAEISFNNANVVFPWADTVYLRGRTTGKSLDGVFLTYYVAKPGIYILDVSIEIGLAGKSKFFLGSDVTADGPSPVDEQVIDKAESHVFFLMNVKNAGYNSLLINSDRDWAFKSLEITQFK
jgi:hypothetical protein